MKALFGLKDLRSHQYQWTKEITVELSAMQKEKKNKKLFRLYMHPNGSMVDTDDHS